MFFILYDLLEILEKKDFFVLFTLMYSKYINTYFACEWVTKLCVTDDQWCSYTKEDEQKFRLSKVEILFLNTINQL
jgi:hypothetical protein